MTRWHENDPLKGARYGRWTVIDPDLPPQKKNGYWHYTVLVQCDCGTQEEIPKHSLKGNYLRGCEACYRGKPVLIGEQYDSWTVLAELRKDKQCGRIFKIQCVCGTIRERSESTIRIRRIRSCVKCQRKTIKGKRKELSRLPDKEI